MRGRGRMLDKQARARVFMPFVYADLREFRNDLGRDLPGVALFVALELRPANTCTQV